MTKEESITKIDDVIHSMKITIEDLEEFKKSLSDFDNNLDGLGPMDNLEGGYEVLGLQEFGEQNKRYDILFGRKPSFYIKSFYDKK
jgi:hypothetical protein